MASASKQVIVIGAAGSQAQAMLEAAGRAMTLEGWIGVDREWRAGPRSLCSNLGIQTVEADVIADRDRLLDLAGDARLVVNFAGPYYRTGGAILDVCIEAGCDYLDICDDADATIELLRRDEAAKAAGVLALIGMGSSPGVTNVLVRAAVDVLGPVEEVELCWMVDVSDVGRAAIQHFWHIFAPIDSEGNWGRVPQWEMVGSRTVEFPDPLGSKLVIELSHPEPITVPRFLPVERVRNFGGITPEDTLLVNWALARLGATGVGADAIEIDGTAIEVPIIAQSLYDNYLRAREESPYQGGGLIVEVHTGGDGYRFSSADETSMEESTGIPAAAGALLMLEDRPAGAGVIAPECLDPGKFFTRLSSTSRGTGSLRLDRLEGRQPVERTRIRDLLALKAS